MKYVIETKNEYTLDNEEIRIAVYTNGKMYGGVIPKRGDDIDVLTDGLLGMIRFLRDAKRNDHDAECKGIVK